MGNYGSATNEVAFCASWADFSRAVIDSRAWLVRAASTAEPHSRAASLVARAPVLAPPLVHVVAAACAAAGQRGDAAAGKRSALAEPGWSAILQAGGYRGRFMVWRSRRVGPKVRVTASVKLLPVPSARIPCFINVHQHNKRCREVGFWVFAERRCWSRTMELVVLL